MKLRIHKPLTHLPTSKNSEVMASQKRHGGMYFSIIEDDVFSSSYSDTHDLTKIECMYNN